MFKNVLLSSAAVLFFSAGLVQAAGALSPEELKKQNEFKAAYGAPGKLDRLEAVKKLDGCTHPSTINMLMVVINTDSFTEVKTAAFRQITTLPATDPSLSQTLAQLFNSLKQNDFETHHEFALQMRNSEFKYAVYEALSEYGWKLRYPDLVSGYQPQGGNGVIGGDPNVVIRKLRGEFEKYLKTFNLITHADLPLQDKNTPASIKSWWQNNQQKLLAADKELLEKYRQEEIEKRKKEKDALASKDAPEKGEKPEKPGKEPAAKDPPVAADPTKLGANPPKKKTPTKEDE